MNEVIIDCSEIIKLDSTWSIEAQYRLLLKSKGVPLKGTFWPKLDSDYIYQFTEDYEKNCIKIKWKLVTPVA